MIVCAMRSIVPTLACIGASIIVASERFAVSAFYRELALMWVNAARIGAAIDETRPPALAAKPSCRKD